MCREAKNNALGLAMVLSTLLIQPVVAQSNDSWWNNTLFYEVFVRSFYDSDGDGIGDLRGLIRKLDYLNDGNPSTATDLGVTGIWLMPIFPSPSYHGYDVTDYRNVSPSYGSLQDFRDLIDSAHSRGIKVIIDFVMNHSSNRHPWFVQSSSGPASPYRGWYTWVDTSPGYRGPWGQQVWHPSGGAYYFGIFSSSMPDLNYANAAVKTAMFEVTRFWLDTMKADGFRLDAIKHLFEDGTIMQDVPATFSFLREFRQSYKSVNRNAIAVGEVWSPTDQVARYVDYSGIDFCFEFDLASAIIDAVRYNQPYRVSTQMQTVLRSYPSLQYAPFLTNHDQDRAFTQLSQDINGMRLAAAIYLTLPGVPFIYYGEEICMTGSGRDENKRTPMQWTAGANAGFTTGAPWMAVSSGFGSHNVQVMQGDSTSLWSWYRALIRMRNETASLRLGDYTLVGSTDQTLYAYARRTQTEIALVLHNFQDMAVSTPYLTLTDSWLPAGVYDVLDILTGNRIGTVTLNTGGGFTGWSAPVALTARGTAVLKIDAATRRPRYTVSGVVRDVDGSGYRGATVEVSGSGSVTTDSAGSYIMKDVDEGIHTVTVLADEAVFDPIALTVTVRADIAGQDFVLLPVSRVAGVTFDVVVPYSTPLTATIYLAGSFNFWDPGPGQAGADGKEHDIALTSAGFRHHKLTLRFGRGKSFEYKYTLGGWGAVEAGLRGDSIAGRTGVASPDGLILRDTVLSWASTPTISVSGGHAHGVPSEPLLLQNFPNPFNPTTTIRYTVGGVVAPSGAFLSAAEGREFSNVRLAVYDILGREVATLVNERKGAGAYTVQFDASGLPSGVFIYQLRTENQRAARRMILLR